ncbi:MAG: glycosyltransferase [Allomuricauda sp.]
MIKNRDIIVMGIQAWDIEIGSNCKNIATEFAKHNRVLYVNPPMDRVSRHREKHTEKIKKRIRVKKGQDSDLVQLNESMWNLYPKTMTESINFIKNQFLFDTLNKINAKRFTKDVQSAIERLGFKDYIIFNDSSMFLGQHIKTMLKPSFYVYYMRDYLTKNPYWKKNGVRLEPRLIKDADCVVNNSTLYTEYGRQFTDHSYMVGQGCDTSLFNDQLREIGIPKDLKSIPKPIIGYVGFLSSRRLSISLLEEMARARPDWSIVLVGPEDDMFNISTLHEMDNVHFLGSRDAKELPNYIKGFDVAINPQLINDATMGNYPRKIDEYLAMGKPTIASATKAMEYFKDHTYLGETAEDYVELIEKALAENSPELEEKRRAFGLSHSWENNVNEIYNCILKVKQQTA